MKNGLLVSALVLQLIFLAACSGGGGGGAPAAASGGGSGSSGGDDSGSSTVVEITGATVEFTPIAGKSTVVELTGTFPSGTTYSWSGSDGSSGSANTERFNVTPTSSASATIDITVTATNNGVSDNYTFTMNVTTPPRVQLILDSITDLGGGNFQFDGHSVDLTSPAGYHIVTCKHTDIFYCSDANDTLSAGGVFSKSFSVASNVDRVAIMLVANGIDGETAGYCKDGATDGECAGIYDAYDDLRYHIPFALDGNNVMSFAIHHMSNGQTHADPQIQNLLNRMSNTAIGGTGYLIRSFIDSEQFYIYDQALAIIAFSKAGEQAAAQKILTAMQTIQHASGAWFFSYNVDGTSSYNAGSAATDRRISGAIAWMAMASNAYHLAFNDGTYDTMTKNALDYLDGLRVNVTINAVSSNPVRFSGVDYTGSGFDETDVISFEHNVDAYSAFKYYGQYSGDAAYTTIASDLRNFLESMWRSDDERFNAGYNITATTLNWTDLYLDTQSWGILTLGETSTDTLTSYKPGLTFNCQEFYESAGYINYSKTNVKGFFDLHTYNVDPTYRFVWTEGTLGQILALKSVDSPPSCHGFTHADFLSSMNNVAYSDGGVPYSTHTTNGDFTTSSSVAGTAWLYFANNNFNPFKPVF